VNLWISLGEAAAIFVLFEVRFAASAVAPKAWHDEVLLLTSAVYIVLGVVLLLRSRRAVGELLRDGFRTPYARLGSA